MIRHHVLAGFEGFPGPIELLMILLALAVPIGVLAAVIFVAAKLINRKAVADGSGSSGLRVLEERYARGEISRDEFLERRAVLMGERPTA